MIITCSIISACIFIEVAGIFIGTPIDDFVANGAMLVSSPKPAKLFNMKKVVFLYTTYGIIELLERGYSERDVKKILGGNFKRVFMEVTS